METIEKKDLIINTKIVSLNPKIFIYVKVLNCFILILRKNNKHGPLMFKSN